MITALFSLPSDAAAAIHTLEARGFRPDQISLVAGDKVDRDAFAIETHSKLPEGVAIGSMSGAAIGALVAGFTTVGAIATGGAGLLVAGPLVAAFAGAGVGAAGGGLLGAGIGAAIPEHEVKHYEEALEKGSVLVGVECDDGDQKDEAKDVFKHFDADKIASA